MSIQKGKTTKRGDELVEYMAPLLPGGPKRDVIVGVNGNLLRIKRGVKVKIPRKYYEVLQHAADQEAAAYQAREQAKQNAKRPIAEM